MGVFVRHEPCPRCGSRDNLARYEDGSAHCFGGCGYWEPRTGVVIHKVKDESDECPLQLDDDLCSDFPGHVVEWLAQYDISIPEALRHGWKYGPKRDQLVFIIRDGTGAVSLYQARNFRPGSKKYFTQGSVADVLPIFHPPIHSRELVLVEDIVSAAKISRQIASMPLLGSSIQLGKLRRLRVLYDKLYVWLDPDKLNEARAIAEQAKWLGFETWVIYTPEDPKVYSDGEITDAL